VQAVHDEVKALMQDLRAMAREEAKAHAGVDRGTPSAGSSRSKSRRIRDHPRWSGRSLDFARRRKSLVENTPS